MLARAPREGSALPFSHMCVGFPLLILFPRDEGLKVIGQCEHCKVCTAAVAVVVLGLDSVLLYGGLTDSAVSWAVASAHDVRAVGI